MSQKKIKYSHQVFLLCYYTLLEKKVNRVALYLKNQWFHDEMIYVPNVHQVRATESVINKISDIFYVNSLPWVRSYNRNRCTAILYLAW